MQIRLVCALHEGRRVDRPRNHIPPGIVSYCEDIQANPSDADACSNSEGPTFYTWIQWMTKPVYIDTVAMVLKKDGDKASIRISVLNRHPTSDWTGGLITNGFGKAACSCSRSVPGY